MKKSELRNKTVKDLREIVRDEGLEIVGAWKMKKDDLVEEVFSFISEAWNIEDDETVEIIEEKPKRKTRSRKIEVYKDGEVVKTLESLMDTFKWAQDNKIANQGWVKESLRNGVETVPGRKYKEGGYKFCYVN